MNTRHQSELNTSDPIHTPANSSTDHALVFRVLAPALIFLFSSFLLRGSLDPTIGHGVWLVGFMISYLSWHTVLLFARSIRGRLGRA